MIAYSLHQPKSTDYDFLRSVHHITLKSHVTKIWGWDEAAQDEFFREDYETGQLQLIQAFGENVGYLHLNFEDGALSIVNILILPDFQGRGLGSQILKDLMTEAKRSGYPIKLGVFKINVRAKTLYELLGFKVCGETQTHYLMKYQ